MIDDEIVYVSAEDLALWERLPVCGCGQPDLVYAAYHRILKDPVCPVDAEPADRLLFGIVAGVLDSIDAIEHGGGIFYSWRTPTGDRLLAVFDRLADGYDYDALVVAEEVS